MSQDPTVSIHIDGLSWGAAYDTLLALESFAARQYHDRDKVQAKQDRYNDLAPIVSALRAAVDGAL